MKKLNISLVIIVCLLLININVYSQSYTLSKANSSITVSGTSSLHDWDVVSNSFNGKIQIKDISTGQLESLEVYIASESLKSGKNAMDKKTYKALKTDEYKNIKFKMVEVKSNKKIDDSTYEMRVVGEMTICGETKMKTIDFLLSKTGNALNATGSCAMKMTDFKIEPPTALLGAITTGDDITIKFNANFKN